jgi:glycosyltransferase involved in cell wall biosynthesis
MAGRKVPDEIVVVTRDTDAQSADIAARFKELLPRGIQLVGVSVDRPGHAPALNVGLERAGGDVVCFVDDDAAAAPDWLARIEAHYAEPEVGGVGGRDIVYRDGAPLDLPAVSRVGRIDWMGRIIGNHHCDAAFHEPIHVDHLKGCNMSFRRELLSGFDEVFLPPTSLIDTDASLTVRATGARLVYDPSIIVHHIAAQRVEPGGRDIEAFETVFGHSHNAMYCLLKHYGLARWAAFAPFHFLIGEGGDIGLGKLLWRLLRGDRGALWQYRAACNGKVAGLRTYLKLRGQPS